MTLDHFTFARAFLHWAAINRLMPWREYKDLMRDVIARHRKAVGCEGKEGFDSFVDASAIARLRRGKHGHKRRCAYHCTVCGRYHLGDAQDLREKRAIKRRAFA